MGFHVTCDACASSLSTEQRLYCEDCSVVLQDCLECGHIIYPGEDLAILDGELLCHRCMPRKGVH